jgi:hypothetical protein
MAHTTIYMTNGFEVKKRQLVFFGPLHFLVVFPLYSDSIGFGVSLLF